MQSMGISVFHWPSKLSIRRSWNHEAVWKAYHKTSNLAKHLLSAQMRGTETMMSDDHVAFTSAALLRAMTDWPQPNQSQASLMADLLDTIRFRRGVFQIQNCKISFFSEFGI